LAAVTADDVSLVAVVAVLGQVHDTIMVVVTLSPVHDNLLRAPPVPHNNALVMVMAAPDKEVMVALGLLPQDAGVMASVQTWLILQRQRLGPGVVGAVVALAPIHHPTLQLKLDVILLDTVNPVEMTVETILTCILFATLRTDNISVLVLEMNILDVALQGHLVEIFLTVRALLPTVSLLLDARMAVRAAVR
jgi:hypothetical protein